MTKILIMDIKHPEIHEDDAFYVCRKRPDNKWQIIMSKKDAILASNFRKILIRQDKANSTITDEINYCICRYNEYPVEVAA